MTYTNKSAWSTS